MQTIKNKYSQILFQNGGRTPVNKIICGIIARQLNVLVLNCGSSSIKFKIVDTDSKEVSFDGQASNLNTNKVRFFFVMKQNFLCLI